MAGPSGSYTCNNNYTVSCKEGYVWTSSRIYYHYSSGSLEATYCCPPADVYQDIAGYSRCLSQWSNYGGDYKQGTEYDNGATVVNHEYTCPSGYTRVMKPFVGWGDSGGGSGKAKYYNNIPQYACCLNEHTYLGPDGTTKFCADDKTNLYSSRDERIAFIEEKSDGTKEFKCLATGWTNYGNRNFRAAIMNRDHIDTPNARSYWACQSVLYYSNQPCSSSYSPPEISCGGSDGFTVSCYNPITDESSGKVTGYNNNKSGYPMDGTSYRGCEVDVAVSGKTGCKDNKVIYRYDLSTSGSYAPSSINYTSTGYDTVMGTFFDSSYAETADWVLKERIFSAQPGYYMSGLDTCAQCDDKTYSKGGNVRSCKQCPYYGGHTWLIEDLTSDTEGEFIAYPERLFVGALDGGTQVDDNNNQSCKFPADNITRIGGTYTNQRCTFDDTGATYNVELPFYSGDNCSCEYVYDYNGYSGCKALFVRGLEEKMDEVCREGGEDECGLRFYDEGHWPLYYNATSLGASDDPSDLEFTTLYDAQMFVRDVVEEFGVPIGCLSFSIEYAQ
ncbi:MAG: hypothetical protein IKP05_03050 [Alphaproteobacteria bacterium]|nr:hypothetical protein [Alphaproteobacteria bacterium]